MSRVSQAPTVDGQDCGAPGCHNPHSGRGWCATHYQRMFRKGTTAGPTTADERFRRRVDTSGPVPAHAPELGNCHVWTGATRHGYGRFWTGDRDALAHAYGWERANGPVPAGLQINHHCDNRACVNPGHLYAGTQADNIRDMDERGRRVSGDRRGNPGSARTRLTEWDVRDIREMWAGTACTLTREQIADGYGVSVATVKAVLSGRNWGWVLPL